MRNHDNVRVNNVQYSVVAPFAVDDLIGANNQNLIETIEDYLPRKRNRNVSLTQKKYSSCLMAAIWTD